MGFSLLTVYYAGLTLKIGGNEMKRYQYEQMKRKKTMKEQVVVAFLENVDWLGQDLQEEVHGCSEEELTEQLAVLGAVNDLGTTYKEARYLAHRLREIVRFPDA
jgi:hypothetical protein